MQKGQAHDRNLQKSQLTQINNWAIGAFYTWQSASESLDIYDIGIDEDIAPINARS